MSAIRPWDFANPNEAILNKRNLRSAWGTIGRIESFAFEQTASVRRVRACPDGRSSAAKREAQAAARKRP
jgi:hypothetical protein